MLRRNSPKNKSQAFDHPQIHTPHTHTDQSLSQQKIYGSPTPYNNTQNRPKPSLPNPYRENIRQKPAEMRLPQNPKSRPSRPLLNFVITHYREIIDPPLTGCPA